jgi:hypothetical protein
MKSSEKNFRSVSTTRSKKSSSASAANMFQRIAKNNTIAIQMAPLTTLSRAKNCAEKY